MSNETSSPNQSPPSSTNDFPVSNKAQSLSKQPEQQAVRRAKLAQMRDNKQAYCNHWRSSISLVKLLQQYDAMNGEILVAKKITVRVSGRMIAH